MPKRQDDEYKSPVQVYFKDSHFCYTSNQVPYNQTQRLRALQV